MLLDQRSRCRFFTWNTQFHYFSVGRTWLHSKLAWLLNKPYITVPIIGVTQMAHLEQATAIVFLMVVEPELLM